VMYFGDQIEAAIALNWRDYTGHGSGFKFGTTEEKNFLIGKRTTWALCIMLWVMLVPIFDVIMLFPFYAISLGNLLFDWLPHSQTRVTRDVTANRVRWTKVVCTLLASSTPIFCAFSSPPLHIVVSIAGFFAVVVVLVSPAILQILSCRFMETKWGQSASRTQFQNRLSNVFIAYAVVFLGLALAFMIPILGIFVATERNATEPIQFSQARRAGTKVRFPERFTS